MMDWKEDDEGKKKLKRIIKYQKKKFYPDDVSEYVRVTLMYCLKLEPSYAGYMPEIYILHSNKIFLEFYDMQRSWHLTDTFKRTAVVSFLAKPIVDISKKKRLNIKGGFSD